MARNVAYLKKQRCTERKQELNGPTSKKRVDSFASSPSSSAEVSRLISVVPAALAESMLVAVRKLEEGVKGGVRREWPCSRSTRRRL